MKGREAQLRPSVHAWVTELEDGGSIKEGGVEFPRQSSTLGRPLGEEHLTSCSKVLQLILIISKLVHNKNSTSPKPDHNF